MSSPTYCEHSVAKLADVWKLDVQADPQLVRYTSAKGTLCGGTERQTWYQTSFTIRPEGLEPITRVLKQDETRSYDDRPIESKNWIDYLTPKRSLHRQYLVSPWTVWAKQGWFSFDEVAIIAALDGSGKWMLAPLTKEESRDLAKKRKGENEARRRVRARQDQRLNTQRGQEAEAILASLNNQSRSCNRRPAPDAPSTSFRSNQYPRRPTSACVDTARSSTNARMATGEGGKVRY